MIDLGGAPRQKNESIDDIYAELAAQAAEVPPERTELGKRKRFALVHLAKVTFSAANWLIYRVLERDVLALLFSGPGEGKTFLMIAVACCLATGTPFYGIPVKKAPVIFIAGEGHNGLKRRFMAWSIRNGVDLDDAPLFISTMPASLLDPESVAEVVAAIDGVAAEHGAPGLVITDTVARNFGPGDENSTQDMGLFVQAIDGIRIQYKSTIFLVHHTGHADKARARGSMALKGAMDFEYRLSKGDDDVVRCDCTKCKDHEKPEPMAFRLRSVELPLTDEEGRPVTSAVLDLTSYEPPPKPGKVGRGKHQSRAKEILDNLHQRHRENLEKDGRDPAGARVTVDEWRTECLEDMPRSRFNDVKKTLIDNGIVEVENGFIYLLNQK